MADISFMKNGQVSVIFASDDGYVQLLGVALCSLFENKKGDYPINIIVMDGGITQTSKKLLGVLEDRYKFKIEYVIPEAKVFYDLPKLKNSYVTYYRTIIASFVPLVEKIIYLDCDVIVLGDIKELFLEDLGNETLGAVPDPWSKTDKIRLGIKGGDKAYFNAGVLLLNMGSWRAEHREAALINFMHQNPEKLQCWDQDALNVIFAGNYKELPPRYNFFPGTSSAKREEPFILHFTSKPWYRFSAVPYREKYFLYLSKTPWKDQKFRKFMDIPFAKKYHIYPPRWLRNILLKTIVSQSSL